MNAEYLLDAIGLLDDELIREAEEYRRPRAKRSYGVWLGWAASFAVVIALGYGLTHLPMGGGNSMAPSTPSGTPAASTPAASAPTENGFPGGGEATGDAAPEDNENFAAGGNHVEEPGISGAGQSPVAEPLDPVIMVDGVLYQSAGKPVPVEPAPEAIKTVTSYTSGIPESDGQTNFSQDLTAQYARIKIGSEWKLVVLMEHEWILFEPAA